MFKKPRPEGYVAPVIDCQQAIIDGEEIRVEQSHKDEVNINNIVKRAGGMELIAKVNALKQFEFDDVTGNDFQESMNAIIKARDTFEQVPSEIRKQFDNDPAKFMDFVHNPENAQALIDMGLSKAPEEVPVMQVEVVNHPETPPVRPTGD